ncbi:ATP-dependent Clp protease proteolytic subunit-related protein 4 [Nymphaea thermarum]|nr:ATP-dependent Clp protease proteolytic subunit-related protein 4 [Nymphaea thermarum]
MVFHQNGKLRAGPVSACQALRVSTRQHTTREGTLLRCAEACSHNRVVCGSMLAQLCGKSREQIEEDINRPKYFSPSEAVEYGIIDKDLCKVLAV